MVRHQRVDSGDCPYTFDVFGEAFSNKSSLKTQRYIEVSTLILMMFVKSM